MPSPDPKGLFFVYLFIFYALGAKGFTASKDWEPRPNPKRLEALLKHGAHSLARSYTQEIASFATGTMKPSFSPNSFVKLRVYIRCGVNFLSLKWHPERKTHPPTVESPYLHCRFQVWGSEHHARLSLQTGNARGYLGPPLSENNVATKTQQILNIWTPNNSTSRNLGQVIFI